MEEKVVRIIELLKESYPDPMCALQYDHDYQLLIAVRLAAQCTDERVNMITPALFERFPTLNDFAEANVSEVEEYVHSCDLYAVPGSVVCDTHCIRITNKLGLARGKEPEKVETQLRAILPPEESSDFCHRLVLHGRAVCNARKPRCEICTLAPWCDHYHSV